MPARTSLTSTRHPFVAILSFTGCLIALCLSGCALAPDAKHRERFHNPLPQLHRIAIIPFYNQSTEPTLDEIAVAEAYYAELQAIPGFEVLPIGVSTLKWREYQMYPGVQVNGDDRVMTSTFQRFAQAIGVDAVVVGAVTDYSPYSPPRFALTTRWYAANPAFHPVPVGYGLPWGTKAEKRIPRNILLETELEVARAQLATQTPSLQQPDLQPAVPDNTPTMDPATSPQSESQIVAAVGSGIASDVLDHGAPMYGNPLVNDVTDGSDSVGDMSPIAEPNIEGSVQMVGDWQPEPLQPELTQPDPSQIASETGTMGQMIDPATGVAIIPLPENWPDPSRLIPEPPSPNGPPEPLPQSGPILTHTRIYRGDDPDVTEKLADYVYARDDGRLGGWQSYLTRSDDFIRFCCHLHITEMLEMRGGRDQSDLIFRWPISRYMR